MLYPLKFEPIYKERIWGGSKLRNNYDRIYPEDALIGESWEISGLQGDVSVVSNGTLAGNDIQELTEVYMGDLVGDSVYEKFGEEFPVLVKLLDTSDTLSVQVHPGDELAIERHNAYGKTEMWYILDAEKDSYIYLGFNKNVTLDEYLRHSEAGTVDQLLRKEKVSKGDVFFVPSGTIHAIGKGIVLAEIQQASDITYRIFDWNRKDSKGNPRDLHAELAIDAICFGKPQKYRVESGTSKNDPVEITKCPSFTVNVIDVDEVLVRDYAALDSFVIYVCLEGEVIVECDGGAEGIMDTETLLIPAMFDEVKLSGRGKMLEIYIGENK